MKHKFWLENPLYLFKTCKIIPMGYMSLEEQMNCVSRFVIFVFIILFLLRFRQALLFLLLSIIFIIILYYLQKSKMSSCEFFNDDEDKNKKIRENVQKIYYNDYKKYISNTDELYNQAKNDYVNNRYTVQKFPTYYVQQIEKAETLQPNQRYISKNNNLVGDANPKTKIAPIHVAPMYDFEYWKKDDFVVPNMMNEKTVQDYYLSGYYVEPENRPKSQNCKQNLLRDRNEYMKGAHPYFIENFEDDAKNVKKDDKKDVVKDKMSNKNIKYGLPPNYNAPSYMKKEEMLSLNKEIFKNPVVPGVYYENEVIEPISSMIGVSYTQQLPLEVVSNKNGEVIYDAKDSQLYRMDKPEKMVEEYVSNYDIYDPRSNGYGTSYRGYVDKMTGKSRYYYDDIESVRRPNYITRNNIDHIVDRAPNYGSVLNDMNEEDMNQHIRDTANNAFKDDMIDFRTDMMERLMRKRNAEMWQLRVAPKSGRQFSTMTLK